ncbi:hypothetical protein [Blastococcus brunescens]|uniref:Uncharacterized protein n=1 Tax=Blastococcus brunescens TaxID=1564165 RepID=A0ABZ1BC04_9ACTN|nr:hypothetical protein [Blastococcus sp. BMG 8361]WRL67294.1 hypothetical protein U6N30_21645 [Blastococcus sp. BMG 8361]
MLTVRGREGGDPASVAFEAVRTGVEGRSTQSSSTPLAGCTPSRA